MHNTDQARMLRSSLFALRSFLDSFFAIFLSILPLCFPFFLTLLLFFVATRSALYTDFKIVFFK